MEHGLSVLFYIALMLLLGYLGGYIANKLKLPRVSGYIIMGMLLSPSILRILPQSFVNSSHIITDLALSIVTYMIGGSLAYDRIKRLGKVITLITVFEAEMAFLFMIGFFALLLPTLMPNLGPYTSFYLPFVFLLAAMASPTDPVASLAVIHEYNARGTLTTTLLGVAAADDAFGIINFSIATSLALVFSQGGHLSIVSLVIEPLKDIILSILVGILGGFLIFILTKKVNRDSGIIVLVFGSLFLTYSIAEYFKLDPLLSTMSAGATVVNMKIDTNKLFVTIEKYYEELIFILFFVLGGAFLQIKAFVMALLVVIFFIIIRFAGKFSGVFIGSKLSKAPKVISKYLAFGLFPQGGIVVGLALTVAKFPQFHKFSVYLINIILGTTALHELLGPISSRFAISKAGELPSEKK